MEKVKELFDGKTAITKKTISEKTGLNYRTFTAILEKLLTDDFIEEITIDDRTKVYKRKGD
jgi:Fic family protein